MTKKKEYFGRDVDKAIIKIKYSDDPIEKNYLFRDKVMPAFQTLISYHYHKATPPSGNEEIKSDCLSYLYEKIPKYDEAKSDKAFSYFNRIAKNYFIQEIKMANREIEEDQYSIGFTDYQVQQGKLDELLVDGIEEEIELSEFMSIFKSHLYKWRNTFKKEQELLVLDAFITLVENAENIDFYNKKAAFWYIKEITGLKSKQIATNLKKIQKKFDLLKLKYQRGDI